MSKCANIVYQIEDNSSMLVSEFDYRSNWRRSWEGGIILFEQQKVYILRRPLTLRSCGADVQVRMRTIIQLDAE